MARNTDLTPGYTENNIILASPITPRANAPLDDRLVVANYDALTNANSFDSIYPGMAVALADTGELYVYAGPESLAGAQVSSNWKKVGDFSSDIADLEQKIQDVSDKSIKKDIVNLESSIWLVDSTTSPGKACVKIDDGFGLGSSATYLYPQFIGFAYSEGDSLAIKNDLSGSLKLGKLDPDEKSTFLDEAVKITNVKVPTQNLDAANKKYVDDQDATTLSAAKKYADEKVSSAYKIKGCKDNFTDLTETGNQSGDVWNIKNAFTLDGKPYPAGTNVVWVEAHTDGEDTDHASGWDALGGTINLEPYAKTDDISGSTTGTGVVRSVTLAGGKLTATASALTADDIPALTVSKISGLQTELDKKANDADVIKSGNNGYKTIILSGTTSKTQIDANGSITMASSQQSDDYNNVSISADRYGDAIAIYREKSSGSSELAPIRVAEPTDDSDAATKKYVDAVKTSTLQNAILKDGKSTIGEAELLLPTEKSFVIRDNADNSRVTFTPQEVEFINEAISLKADAGFDAITITASTNDAGNENGITLKTGDNDGPVKIHGIAVETDESLIADTDAVNVGYVKEKIGQIDTGVTSFGGKTGAITVDGTGSSSYPVKLAMTGNKLGATISGLGTAAAKAADDFATAAQGTKADNAVSAIVSNSNYLLISPDGDVITKEHINLTVCTDIANDNAIKLYKLADAYAVKTYVDNQLTAKAGVTSVDGKAGAITLASGSTSPGSVNFSIDSNNKISGKIVDREFESFAIDGKTYGRIKLQEGASKYDFTINVATNLSNLTGSETLGLVADANATKTYVDSALTWEVL